MVQKRGDNFISVMGKRILISSMSILQALLGFTFGSSLDQVPDRLAEFEASTIRYKAEPNVDSLSDSIKRAVLVRGCPEQLKTHVQMNLQAYQSYSSIRNAVQSYTEAKRTWRPDTVQTTSSTDMEVDAVGKDGFKGKSKAGKGKGKNQEGDECYICGRQGHFQKDCWYKDTKGNEGKGKTKDKGKQKGKSKDKNNPVAEVRQDDAQSSSSSQIVAYLTSDWIFAVTWADNLEEIYESEVEILLHSGAYDHLCGPEIAVHSPLLPRLDSGTVRNADGSEIPTHGRRRVRFRLEDGQVASVEFQVMNVKRCIFSIGRLIEQAFGIDFEKQILTGPDGRQARVHRQGRLYYLRAQLLESWQSPQVNPVWVDERGNEQERNEHGESRANSDTVGEPMYGQTAKGVREPRQPTEKERREHSLTYVPFRNCCKACVLLRSKENPHRPRKLYERKHQDKTSIQLDYMFPCGDGDCKVLTMTETKTGYTSATMVLTKGSGDRYAVHELKQMIDEVGGPEANIQPDSEGAAFDLARAAAALRPDGRHEVNVTPRGSLQSNG